MLRDPEIKLEDLEQFKLGLRNLPEDEQSVRSSTTFVCPGCQLPDMCSVHALCTPSTCTGSMRECAGGPLCAAAHRNV